MTFLSGIRLPPDVERGVVGGPRFSTTVLELDSGHEQRNINWSDSKGRWDAAYGLLRKFEEEVLTETDLGKVLNFFYVVRGRAFSFRFKDWSDYEIGPSHEDPQFLALGDGALTTVQVFKRYQFGPWFFDRPITKVVDGTVTLLRDNVAMTETTDWTMDYDRGVLTLVDPLLDTGGTGPMDEEVLGMRGEFDVHARLDVDDLNLSMEIFNAGSVPNIPLVELLGHGVE
jgi:uncharacterized protein (TIGR02217 family)